LSEPSAFRLDLVVRDEDIDALGHASNIAFVRWIQDVALAHSAAVGLGLEAYRKLGAVFVVARHEVEYLRPAFRGDALQARTWISTAMAAKWLRSTEIVRTPRREADAEPGVVRSPDGELLARAVTTWGYVELATGRPRRIPEEVRVAFEPWVH
jgi:acyl-CoA thioester hydrolase